MAVIRNTYETTFSSIATMAKYTIDGLTSETSTTTTPYYVTPEVTLYFLRNLYQTLLDAGCNDAVLNESDYSITVLGFKFFCVCQSYRAGYFDYGICPYIYVYGMSDHINNYGSWNLNSSNSYYKATSISNYNSSSDGLKNVKVSYSLIVRGCKDCVQIVYSSYSYPNGEMPLLFIAKAKNLITSEDSFLYTNVLSDYSNYTGLYWYFRSKTDLYNNYSEFPSQYSYYLCPRPYCNYQGLNSLSKFVCKPIVTYGNAFLIDSMIEGNTALQERGRHYKIGSNLYFCNGYRTPNTLGGQTYAYDNGSLPILFRVSDN